MRLRSLRWRFVLFAMFMMVVSLANTGCLAALLGGAAAGGAAGYAYYRGNVYHDYPAPFGATWMATQRALQDMRLPVVGQRASHASGEIESVTDDGYRVMIYLEPSPRAAGPVTRVHIRVGTFGDHELSGFLHDRIMAHLHHVQPPPNAPPSIVNEPAYLLPRPTPTPATQEPPLTNQPPNQPPAASPQVDLNRPVPGPASAWQPPATNKAGDKQ